ncbi:MAG: Ku protein, partial [Sphingobacteriales bacterium]
MARRPLWQGNLRLSLVSCPIALYSATSKRNDVSFHLLNPKTNNRIRMIPTDPDAGPVERADLVKGYEISKNHYVTVTPEELDAVKLETNHTLDIERFVDANTIDRLYWNDPFYILPADDSGLDAYTVIRDAMAEAGRIALGRVVMHTRERLMAIC